MSRPSNLFSAGAAPPQVACHLVFLAAALSAVLASCAGAVSVHSPSPSPHATPSPPSPSRAPSDQPSAPPTVSPTPPIATANEPVCASSRLQIAYWPALSGGAAGSVAVSLGIWNRGTRACKLRGWARLQFLSPSEGLVPTHWVETTTGFFGSAHLVTVSLLPCGKPSSCVSSIAPAAVIDFSGDDVIPPCESVAGARVTVPGASTPIIANLRVDGFPDGQTLCSGGRILVLPIQSSLAALGPTLS